VAKPRGFSLNHVISFGCYHGQAAGGGGGGGGGVERGLALPPPPNPKSLA
jgi:hypothetical protein